MVRCVWLISSWEWSGDGGKERSILVVDVVSWIFDWWASRDWETFFSIFICGWNWSFCVRPLGERQLLSAWHYNYGKKGFDIFFFFFVSIKDRQEIVKYYQPVTVYHATRLVNKKLASSFVGKCGRGYLVVGIMWLIDWCVGERNEGRSRCRVGYVVDLPKLVGWYSGGLGEKKLSKFLGTLGLKRFFYEKFVDNFLPVEITPEIWVPRYISGCWLTIMKGTPSL